MSPAEELSALYEQWRCVTEAEGAAIEAGSWSQVQQYQSAKARLQPRIVEVSQRLDAATHEELFRPVVEALIQLERTNSVRVEKQRQAAQQQKQELDRSSRQLRQVHQSYVPQARAHCQSYS